MKQYIDLHSHTFYSDGSDTPESLVRAMHMSGVDVMALTDHDTTAGYAQAQAEAEKYQFRIIPGVEISTARYHILGLNIDPKHQGLQSLLQRIRYQQELQCKRRIDILAQAGAPLSFEKLKRGQEYARLGKWNIIVAMYRDPECRVYLQKEFDRLPAPRETFLHYLGKNGIAASVKHDKDVHSQEAIETIHAASGFAIIAHPFKEVKNLEKELGALIRKGLDGLEIQPNYGASNDPFRTYALEKGLLMTYGSDFHGAGYERPLLGRKENAIENVDGLLMKWRNS